MRFIFNVPTRCHFADDFHIGKFLTYMSTAAENRGLDMLSYVRHKHSFGENCPSTYPATEYFRTDAPFMDEKWQRQKRSLG